MIPIYIALAGSIGAVCRFVLDGHLRARYDHSFPWATVIINVSGSFILGFVSGLLLTHQFLTETVLIIGTGFCGGYTTFSTASFETVRLLEKRQYKRAAYNAIGSILFTVMAATVGLMIGRIL